MQPTGKVLIFDSGVGGLTILEAIRQTLPAAQLVFASDTEAYPYGNKPELELIERVSRVVDALVAAVQPDILVVACNTASTVVLPRLRERLTIDVVGVVPAIKPAAKLSKTGHIGVLATPATVARQYTKDLITEFADHCQVELIGSATLVELAERKLHNGEVDLLRLQEIAQPWLDGAKTLDTIVLACTHFPLLKPELNNLFEQYGHEIRWVDSATGIANRTRNLLKQSMQATDDSNKPVSNQAIMTSPLELSKTFVDYLAGLGITQIDTIELG